MATNTSVAAWGEIWSDDDVWRVLWRRLLGWTAKRHQLTRLDAQDVVQEAVLQHFAGGGARDKDGSILAGEIRSRINGIAVNLRRKKCRRAVRLTADGTLPDDADACETEERIVGLDWTKRALDVLLDRTSSDNIVFAMVCQMAHGVTDPFQLAEALGSDVRQVYNARRRLQAHVVAVRRALHATGRTCPDFARESRPTRNPREG
jgi:hypothetical protein